MKFLTVAAATAALMIAGSANAAVNLLANGGFETGSLSGWTLNSVGSGTGYSPTVVIATDGVGRGYPAGAFSEGVPGDNAAGPFAGPSAYAVYFSSDVGSETLTQSIDIARGWYEVGFDAYIPHNGYVNPLDAGFTAKVGTYTWPTVQLKSSSNAEQTWTHYSALVFVDPAQTNVPTSFSFAANGYPAVDVLVDNVYVTASVPEPMSWALMLVGFGGMGAVLRSQRRRQALTA